MTAWLKHVWWFWTHKHEYKGVLRRGSFYTYECKHCGKALSKHGPMI